MINIEEKSKCCGCHACYNICPKNAIEMKEDEKGFKYPTIDKEMCINCGLCEKVCPIINKRKTENMPKAYACYNKNEKIRLESSSGGIFTIIAEFILDNNGVIYGAAFNDNWEVEHIRINNKKDLNKLRTSKYVQSNINTIYKLAKKDLEEGINVLFTGTPCQVNGLYSFLNKEYSNLYTQDIICHGVPSAKVWRKYLEFRKERDSEKPLQINFRQKDNGWKLYALLFQYKNNAYKINHSDDLFMQAFLRNASLRDSCYNCSFKEKNRKTDITLADFWGINNILPEFNDDKGTSLVIVNTQKGQELLNNIKDKMIYNEVDFEQSIQYNSAMYKSVLKPELREEFFDNLDKMKFNDLVEKYTIKPKKPNMLKRIVRKVKIIIKEMSNNLFKE